LLIGVLYDQEILLSLIRDSLKSSGLTHIAEDILERYSTAECAEILTTGIKIYELKRKIPNLNPGELMDFAFAISPCPNLYFQRDTMALTPGGISFSAMKMEGRKREADLLRTIFENHPEFKDHEKTLYPIIEHDNPPTIEGGDVIILSHEAVAIGISERTDEKAIYFAAKALSVKERSSSGNFKVLKNSGFDSDIDVIGGESSKRNPIDIHLPAMKISGNADHGLPEFTGFEVVTRIEINFPFFTDR
jgi:arginine deiminase